MTVSPSGAVAARPVRGSSRSRNWGPRAPSSLKSTANMNAVAVIEKSLPSGGTPTATVDFTVTTAHPLVTLLTMVAPSPDWFVGVSGSVLARCAGRLAGVAHGRPVSLRRRDRGGHGVLTVERRHLAPGHHHQYQGDGQVLGRADRKPDLHSPVGSAGDHQCGDLHCG